MGMDAVKLALVVILIVFVVVRAIVRRRGRDVELGEEEEIPPKPASKVRLTELQQVALCSASFAPIYAEDRSEPILPGAETYSQRTIDSLVSRGLIESDGSGGYTATKDGLIGWQG